MDPGTERFRRRKRSARLGGGAIGQLKRLFLVMAAIDTPEVVKLLGELGSGPPCAAAIPIAPEPMRAPPRAWARRGHSRRAFARIQARAA